MSVSFSVYLSSVSVYIRTKIYYSFTNAYLRAFTAGTLRRFSGHTLKPSMLINQLFIIFYLFKGVIMLLLQVSEQMTIFLLFISTKVCNTENPEESLSLRSTRLNYTIYSNKKHPVGSNQIQKLE